MLKSTVEAYPMLKVITDLLEAFHDNDVRYCHWKSSEHLAASMTGETDLDILFELSDRERIESMLDELQFKQFVAIKPRRYRNITDYFGLDIESGKLIHLHAHFGLTIGEHYLKGYQPDWTAWILENRLYDDYLGIYRIDPSMELILLFVREALKLRRRDRIASLFKDTVKHNDYLQREWRWLKVRSNEADVYNLLETLFAHPVPVHKIVSGEMDVQQLQKMSRLMKIELENARLHTPLKALMIRWYRETSVLSRKLLQRIQKRPVLSRRISPRGGVVVAVIGADGSGKSTVVSDLRKTFDEKLDVYSIYFGRGDGKSSMARNSLQSLRDKVKGSNSPSTPGKSSKRDGLLKTIYRVLKALLVSMEKKANLERMLLARRKGMLVICDRYPQNQVMEINDGPLLTDYDNSRNPLLRRFARAERSVYQKAEVTPPDIVFKLIADVEVVERRKPGETSIERLGAKIEGIKRLQFGKDCRVITIDASKPLEEVLSLIKGELWKLM